jgi:hypothetical protein
MLPDDVCEKHMDSGLKIKVWEEEDTIFIEGTREALLFVSELFAAQAEASDDGFEISPFGPGKARFAPGSTKGIYIHRV